MKLSRSIALPLLALAGAWLARGAAAPTISFEISPPNPAAGQTVLLRDTTEGGGPGGLWDFGDGSSEQTSAPAHSWTQAGTYTVRLLARGESAEAVVAVSPADTLRLIASHPFEVSVEAYARASGAASAARAHAESDRFGWFSFPELTGDPRNPEVTVKILEAPWAHRYWIFWSGMTSLDYQVTVRDTVTDHVEVYRKEGPEAPGGWDTQSFELAPSPTPPGPTAVATREPSSPPPSTATPSPGATRTRTRTRTATATPTITPTPASPPVIWLRAIQWQWNFCPLEHPCPGLCPTGGCGAEITLHAGRTYQVIVYNGDSPDVTDVHQLSTISGIGLAGGALPQGSQLPPQTITPMTAGDFNFLCTNFCGVGHDGMLGVVHVVP